MPQSLASKINRGRGVREPVRSSKPGDDRPCAVRRKRIDRAATATLICSQGRNPFAPPATRKPVGLVSQAVGFVSACSHLAPGTTAEVPVTMT